MWGLERGRDGGEGRGSICIPGDIFLVEVDVVAGGFLRWQSVPNTKENRINEERATAAAVNKGAANGDTAVYLRAGDRLGNINMHFVAAGAGVT